MSQILNAPTILLALGVIQPATSSEVSGFLADILPDPSAAPRGALVHDFMKEREGQGHVIRVELRGGESFYALTLAGHRYLTVGQRKLRDKLRFFLLRDAHRVRFRSSDGGATRLVGDAPTLESSSSIKGCAANNFGHSVPRVRTYWPRISRQFDRSTGLSAPSSDTFPEWLSFRNRRQCELAVGIERGQFKLDYEGLAASLGVSVKIVSQVSRRPARHYRSFSIQKKSGGERKISSPRVFLKVMQWFLDDFILDGLPVHSSVHSFVTGKSVATNGKLHVCQSYVGSIDIENYFGSITKAMVQRLLLENGFLDDEVSLISALTTLNDTLPQGAPTSATLSNAILYGFDCDMAMSCEEAGLVYSRYADDITISGSSREAVERALSRAKRQLANRSFRTNPSKTRIVSDRARQVVTGVVVNAVAQPSRTYRRNVRAKFHNAAKQKTPAGVEIRALAGHLAYLKMFSSLTGSRQIAALERDLRKVRAKKQE